MTIHPFPPSPETSISGALMDIGPKPPIVFVAGRGSRMFDTEGRAYYARKRAEGKTAKEAIRCLKRQLSDRVFKAMRADAATARDPSDSPTQVPARAAWRGGDGRRKGARLTAQGPAA